jgi:hypothetical protein
MPLVTDEPDALIGLVRVCGGSGEQSLLLPGNLPGISPKPINSAVVAIRHKRLSNSRQKTK